MKCACRAVAWSLAAAACLGSVRADNAAPVVLAPAPPTAGAPAPIAPPISPATLTSQSELEAQTESPDVSMVEAEEAHENFAQRRAISLDEALSRQAAYDADWMLRDYHAQLRSKGLASTADLEQSEAEVANPEAKRAADDPFATLDEKAQPSPDRRADAAGTSVPKPLVDSLTPPLLRPLLPPLDGNGQSTTSASSAITRLDAWGSTTDGVGVSTISLMVPGIHDLRSEDLSGSSNETELDVPGLTAERQSVGDPGDLNLPDEQMEAATENTATRTHHDFLLPTVAANDSNEFFRRQSEALSAPVPPNSSLALHPPVAANQALPLSHALPPPAPPKMPPMTGIRTQVADPFDIIGGHEGR